MPELLTMQDLANGHLDVKALGEAANGDENTIVTTRTGNTYPSAERAINIMFKNGGLPAMPFPTLAKMQTEGVSLADGQLAMVYNENANNGLYVKTAGAWVKSAYDPVGMAEKKINEVQNSIYGIVEPTWELGTFLDASGNKYGSNTRARIKNQKNLAPNTVVKAASSDPALVVSIVSWDKDGNYMAGAPYSQKSERKVTYYYNVLAKYSDERIIDVNTIKDLVTVSHVTAIEAAASDLSKYSAASDARVNNIEKTLAGQSVATVWNNGAISPLGAEPWYSFSPRADRLTIYPHKTRFTGELELALNHPDKKFIVTLFNEEGAMLNWSGIWSKGEYKTKVAGYYNIMLAWDDNRNITVADATEVTVKHSYPTNPAVVNRIKSLEDMVLTGQYKPTWEVGSITDYGTLWDKMPRDRLRIATEKTPLKGMLEVQSLNPLMSVSIVEYDLEGVFIKYGAYETKPKKEINGYFNILVRWNDNRIIQPADANILIEINSGSRGSAENTQLSWYEDTPRFSSNSFGSLLGVSVVDLISAFDTLVGRYHGTVLKEIIGKTTDGLHDMYGYTLTPDDYQATIAITMHTHGNERYNPLGFYGLLEEINKNGAKHEFIKWLKYNVRWLVIPVASPTAVTQNTRSTGLVNLNRNYDYLWDLYEPSWEKGIAPYSLAEASNIRNFFVPKKDEINFHMDLHDIPTGGGSLYSHRPAHPSYFLWLNEQRIMRDYLAEISGGKAGGAYELNSGSTTNLFLGSFGVPSVTPEHVTTYWSLKNLDINQQLAKATEQICGFLYMFRSKFLGNDKRGSSFYRRDFEIAFASKEHGIYSWDKAQVFATLGELSFLTPDPTNNSILLNEVDEAKATVLVISGTTADDNNSDLVVLRSMQRVDAGAEMYLAHLKKCNLVIAPAIKTMGMTDSQLRAKIAALTTKYKPDYTMLVTADGFDAVVGSTVVRHKNENDITKETKLNDAFKLVEVSGLDSALTGRYISVNLKNEVPRHAAYPHTVAKWVGLVVNDLASYFAELFSD